jgi:hypothetical protein
MEVPLTSTLAEFGTPSSWVAGLMCLKPPADLRRYNSLNPELGSRDMNTVAEPTFKSSADSIGPAFRLVPGDAQFEYEAVRTLGAVDYGGAAVGEVLAACSRITPGDYDSWHQAWSALADKVAAEADGQSSRERRQRARRLAARLQLPQNQRVFPPWGAQLTRVSGVPTAAPSNAPAKKTL